ncbi:MAG: septum formation initiator family protein [Eggerthellaceae bacterium]|nr:septum formation initiator family protein [Eggerthellaceae bacterium]
MTGQGHILAFEETRKTDQQRSSYATPQTASRQPAYRSSAPLSSFEALPSRYEASSGSARPSVKTNSAKFKQVPEKRPSVKQPTGKLQPVKQASAKRPSVSFKEAEPVRKASNSQSFEVKSNSSKFDDMKRSRFKNKASKEFSKQFRETNSSASESGPRAALYKAEMGRKHKRITQMQKSAYSKNSSSKGIFAPSQLRRSPRFIASILVLGCLLLSCIFLYPVAKQYYLTIRHYDQLEAEYAAVQNNNQNIQNQVDALSTAEGIEDLARKEYGLIKEGEQGGTVYGLENEGSQSANMPNIPSGKAEAPQAWYTAFLDVLFGVK